MTVISSPNHWWQNWPKTRAYVAEKMFFPSSAEEIASAIRTAEADRRPLRAVGGGWSFSDASLPGAVTTNRPGVHALEAIAEALPHAETFPLPDQPSIAAIAPGLPAADLSGSMVMHNDEPGGPEQHIDLWMYEGAGKWTYGQWMYQASEAGFLDYLAQKLVRPIRNPMGVCIEEADIAGSLVMFDLTTMPPRPSPDWFYNGNGVWSVGLTGNSGFEQGDLRHLRARGRVGPGKILSPRAAGAGESLALVMSLDANTPKGPDPVYLINTRSLVSSLQQKLPGFLSQKALDATAFSPANGRPLRFFFHVEAGITIAELGVLLAHQSPRLSLQAISGSPGATLAGALSTATHGAEFNWPLLVDTVKAVHLVGPCGLHWWIEGDESIADAEKLRAAYPNITWHRIIAGKAAVDGILPQDWLNAAIVSMGSMGVLCSVVLEVVPLFGVREVVVQKTWGHLGYLGNAFAGMDLPTMLRTPATSPVVSARITKLLQSGNLNGSGIPQVDGLGNLVNQYADLAINPNKRADGDYDCWIGNREMTKQLPIDSQPSSSPGIIDGMTKAFTPDVIRRFGLASGLEAFTQLVHDTPDPVRLINQWNDTLQPRIMRLAGAADVVDVGLDTVLTPIESAPDVAQALLTGILSGLLSTANCAGLSDKTGVVVGNLGFPESGVMGTAIEIAMAPADAFGFVQTEILDHVSRSFFGYVSIRLCSNTQTLMGMQQFGTPADPCSVMIEVVSFGTEGCRNFIHELQRRTVERIGLPDSDPRKLNAMLHWGLENELLTDRHLGNIKALQARTRSGMSKLDTFKRVRARLHSACPASLRVFDNSFTDRLGLSRERAIDISYLMPLLLSPDN